METLIVVAGALIIIITGPDDANNKSITGYVADVCTDCYIPLDIFIATVAYGELGGGADDGYINSTWEFIQ